MVDFKVQWAGCHGYCGCVGVRLLSGAVGARSSCGGQQREAAPPADSSDGGSAIWRLRMGSRTYSGDEQFVGITSITMRKDDSNGSGRVVIADDG